MHAASRESVEAVQGRFDEIVADLDSKALTRFADELASISRLLIDEVLLRKHIAGRGEDSAEPKVALVEQLFAKKVAPSTLDLLKAAVSERWSKTRDLTNALERFADIAILIDAERSNKLESVEDELFRFGRTLDANPRLSTYLSDNTADIDGRLGLLDDVLGGKASDYTVRLLKQTIRLLGDRNADLVVPELAELAAARRGESVAHVTAARELSDEQRERLERVLSQIYDRNMSVQLDVDPDVLGGLSITVGDEVVDGTIATRLSRAASQLPH